MPLPFTDNFTDTNGEPWDSTKWTTDVDVGCTIDIQGNEGRQLTTGAFGDWSAAFSSAETEIQDAKMLLHIDPESPSGNGPQFNMFLRSSGDFTSTGFPADGYKFRYQVRSGSNAFLLQRRIGGSNTSLSETAHSRTTNTGAFWIRAEVEDSGTDVIIRGKAWEATDSEPGAWDFEHTDTSPGILLGATGRLHLTSFAGSGTIVDNRIDDVEFDALGGGTPGTVTPGVVAATVTVPTPTITAAAKVTPGVVAATMAAPTPAILAASVVEPGTVVAVMAAPTPTIDVTAASVVTPDVVAAVLSVPTPGITAAANVTPGVVVSVTTVPTPSVLAASVVAPGTVAVVTTVPTPGITAAANVTPNVVVTLVAVATPTVSAAALVTPSAVAALFSVPTPSILAVSTGIVSPDVVVVTVTVPVPTPSIPGFVSPSVISLSFTVPTIKRIRIRSGAIVINVVRFYRNGSTQFILAQGIPRSSGTAYRTDESWAPASGKFNDPGGASGVYGDLYDDIYHAPLLNRSAMFYARPVWLANKSASDAVLTAKVNAVLTGYGFTRTDGSVIT